MDALQDPFSDELRRSLGDVSAGGTTPEELIRLGEEHLMEQAHAMARHHGYASADEVLDRFEDLMSHEDTEIVNGRLASAQGLEEFGRLLERSKAADAVESHEARERAGGCLTHNEFVETSGRASAARAAGSPDIEAELKIARTDDSTIAGLDTGGIGL